MAKPNVSLIGRSYYKYNDKITINIPTVNQMRGFGAKEDNRFWQDMNIFVDTPTDRISELDSMGIDFTTLSEYNYFIFMFLQFQPLKKQYKEKCSLFKGFNFWNLNVKEKDDNFILVNGRGTEYFNEKVYTEISELLCYMACREKTPPKIFGNDYAKKKRIEFDYKKKQRLKINNQEDSNIFDRLILRLVCNANFPYDFRTIGEISLFELMYSIKQIDKDISVDDLMLSRYYCDAIKNRSAEDLSRYVI